jgi:PAS domain S-box-containing protein
MRGVVVHATIVRASHDPGLVALSVVISIVAAYAEFGLFERLRAARGRVWLAWLTGGAMVDGIGTWSMHYTGKLALRLPVPVRFDWRLVILSLVVGIAGSAAAFAVAGRNKVGWIRTVLAAVLLGGVGISGLHFTGMAGLRLEGIHHSYRWHTFVLLSIVLAIGVSALALALAFRFREDTPGHKLRRHVAVVLRGSANPIMHYTAMAAVVFYATREPVDFSHAVSIPSLGVLGISLVPVMVLIAGILTSIAGRLETQRALLDDLFDQSPLAVALLDTHGRIVRVNREFKRLFGFSPAEVIGRRESELIVPPELHEEHQRHADLVASGERIEADTIRTRKDGSRVHVSMVRVPVSVAGGKLGTYSIFADITERRRAEDELKSYPRRLIETQEAEGQRIARELHDEVGQTLTSVGMMLQTSRSLPPDQGGLRIDESQSLLRELIGKVRDLALDLRPAMLDDFGLGAALEWLVQRYSEQTGVRVDFESSGLDDRRFRSEIEIAAYRIVQEALTNVARHAQVREARVRVTVTGDTLRVEIEDRGAGFDPRLVRTARTTVGLAGMRERASILGGRLSIESAPGKGVRVIGELPP